MEKIVVCPICWRANCRLFIKMNGLRFTDAERSKFFKAFHRDVCKRCRRLSCHGCDSTRKLAKTKALPAWWAA